MQAHFMSNDTRFEEKYLEELLLHRASFFFLPKREGAKAHALWPFGPLANSEELTERVIIVIVAGAAATACFVSSLHWWSVSQSAWP